VIRFAPFPLRLPGSMPKCLTPAQVEQYRDERCAFPIGIMSETEAAELRRRLKEATDPAFVSWHQDSTYRASAPPMS
jgi:hypothetical protein